MKKIITAHQPVYMPWLGLFHKISLADEFCIFDIAQYQTKDYNNRNKIKTQSGEIWLSVPVESKNHFQKKICDIKILNNGWNRKHFKSISLAYKKSKYFTTYIDEVENLLLGYEYKKLTELNFAILNFALKVLGISVKVTKASDYELSGYKSDLVLDLCLKLGATDYIFGSQGLNYANIQSFNEAGVRPYFQNYVHPKYSQLHGDFVPYMSFVDLIFNHGDNSLEIIKSGNVDNIRDLNQ